MKIWSFSFFALIILFISGLQSTTTELQTTTKKITVNGKEATVLALIQPDGTFGIRTRKGANFDVLLKNTMQVPTSIHWHGLILPNGQDGVAFITQFPIYPGLSNHYNFPLVQSGTYWMHSHFGLQEQQLLSAPLIIDDPQEAKIADQDVIVFLADFSFTPAQKIFEQLRHKNSPKSMSMMKMSSQDIVDVDYDALLTNYRTLDNPDIVKVTPGNKVRLRIIDGASSTNFFINIGNLDGELIAVDGNRIKPLHGSHFELAVAQRLDIIVTVPQEGGTFPILAVGEGTDMQTGLVLTTKDTQSFGLRGKTAEKAKALTNEQEKHLQALYPLAPKPIDQHVHLELGGDMSTYSWTINGQSWPEITPVVVEQGKRVEITFKNNTSMSHPMHLHGHVFQVTAIDGQPIDGAMRDTVLVTPNSSLSIQFDANNPGVWPLHCHLLYHLEGGMLTVVRYKDFIQPLDMNR